jgi:hypothetical protein
VIAALTEEESALKGDKEKQKQDFFHAATICVTPDQDPRHTTRHESQDIV